MYKASPRARSRPSWPVALFSGLMLFVVGCSDNGVVEPDPDAAVELTLAADAVTVEPGGSSEVNVQVARMGFTGVVTVNVVDPPSGLFPEPPVLIIGSADTTGTLVLTTAADAVPGTYTVTVRAAATTGVTDTAIGAATHTVSLEVVVVESAGAD